MNTIVITPTSGSLQGYLGEGIAVGNPHFLVSYTDYADGYAVDGFNTGAMNGVTPVDIVGAPASGKVRVVVSLSIYNKDAVPHNFILGVSSGAMCIEKGYLLSHETFTNDGTYGANGAKKLI